MKITVKNTKNLIENYNQNHWIYEKLTLISIGWWTYGLYQGDFVRSIWKWIAKWKINHVYDIIFQNQNSDKIVQVQSDFIL